MTMSFEMFRSRFGIPIPDDELHNAPFYRPADDSPEIQYMKERRKQLGGLFAGTKSSRQADRAGFRIALRGILQRHRRPRSFDDHGFRSPACESCCAIPKSASSSFPLFPTKLALSAWRRLFRQVGIYSSVGQLYEPVDMDTLLYYKEAKDGQILEEGITEAGSMCSFIAAGTAYANHGINTIPFFIYYSMFGFQRIGDLIWAAADMRTRGFLIGGTAGRTTLAGEGLQHQDGHSHVLALSVPNLLAYDPAFAYEIAVIIQEGIKRMYVDQESIFYYLTVTNEPLPMPEMPARARKCATEF